MERIIFFLDELDENNIYYVLRKVRDSIMVDISIPGQRWEVEFFGDGHVECEKFFSNGDVSDIDIKSLLSELHNTGDGSG